MSALIDQRCWNHAAREAVVRCPECRRFYCRECVTEHAGRMMCAVCIAAAARPDAVVRESGHARWALLSIGGVMLAWLLFYDAGAYLARIPSDFFELPSYLVK